MTLDRVDQQEHGYRNGHQLLSASVNLPRDDQDTIDRLSDMSGPLRPGETFAPYLTAYPLPSRTHYVLAKTWQDLAAPRAGCVLTRSLLIPTAAWENAASIQDLLSLLIPVERGAVATSAAVVPHPDQPLPTVKDGRIVELVEAMFLENRQPIVMFEAPEADVICARILTALWPGLRRSFAGCTFALAPRKIDGREFDLAFAPKSARSRFADFAGRRIEVGASSRPRHRWSEETARQIFESERPGFADLDVLGVLKNDDRGDESALRLSLLWNELSAKADTEPTAVLGLMDILNSRRDGRAQIFDRILPMAAHAAEKVSATMPGPDGWRFLGALVGKLPAEAESGLLLERIGQSATDLAKRDPDAALSFLSSDSAGAQNMPDPVLAGVGDGLAPFIGVEGSNLRLSNLPAETGLRLFVLSSDFARKLVHAARLMPSSWIPSLLLFLKAADRDTRPQARDQLVPLLDDGVLAPLLPPVLESVRADELADIALAIGNRTAFETDAFDEPLANAARDQAKLEALRNSVARHVPGPGADRFLLNTLSTDAADVAWLATLEPSRGCRLLVALLRACSDRVILAAQRDTITRNRMFEILRRDLAFGASQMVRILSIGEVEVGPLLEISQDLLPHLATTDRERFTRHVVERAFAEAHPDDQRVRALIPALVATAEPRWMVRISTPANASSGRIGANLVVLNSTPHDIRTGVIGHVDELSDRLIHHGSRDLVETAYAAWAAMIADAGSVNPGAQLQAAISTLSFALKLPRSPVSALIVTSFPLVHAQLLQSKGDDDFRTLPALLLLPFTFFVDWDRAKSTRKELVDGYLASSWPPADLLLAGIHAGAERAILSRLSRSASGRRYTEKIERDSRRLGTRERESIEQTLSNFFANPTSDWE